MGQLSNSWAIRRTLESRVEEETPRAHHEITTIGNQEDLVMLMATTAQNALDPEPHKQQVGQGVDDLS